MVPGYGATPVQDGPEDQDEDESAAGTPMLEPKYVLPFECKIEVLKEARLLEVGEEYWLAAHPYPQMEGQMILY